MYTPPTIGADPECFVWNKQHRYISAHDFLPGTKAVPHRVDRGAVQVDGVAAEFNINPASSAEEFSENIRTVLLQMQELIQAHDPNLRLRVTPTAVFTRKYFKKLPATALALGCEPDYDAYTNTSKTPPETTRPMRTGGGHIHIGWAENENIHDAAHIFDCVSMVQQLDASLYLCSLLWDNDNLRRTLYGQIGSFRPKPYGVEYRPLSNAWVADPDLHLWVFNATQHASMLLEKKNAELQNDRDLRSMVEIIRRGGTVSRTAALDAHSLLVEDFDFPPLPESYLTA